MSDGGHVKMTKLSDTQAILLSAAAQRRDWNLLPLPGSLRGGAAVKVVGALLARGLAREEVTDRTTRAESALNTVWRNEEDGRAILLRITPEGLAAIGVEPAPTDEPEAAPVGEEVDYRFNEGTNSAGAPAAGTPNPTPADAPKKRGRPKKTTEPTEAPKKPGRPKKVAAEPAARLRASRATTPSRRS